MVNSFIAKKDLETEFSVVRNEFESGENYPPGVLEERVLSTAYLWHNYGKSTIGSKEDIEKVFDPFTRGSNAEGIKGTGLGLSLARRIVEDHHGRIDVTSTVSQGTTFTVMLPLRKTPAATSIE